MERLNVTSLLRTEAMLPAVSIDRINSHVRPSSANIIPLTSPYVACCSRARIFGTDSSSHVLVSIPEAA